MYFFYVWLITMIVALFLMERIHARGLEKLIRKEAQCNNLRSKVEHLEKSLTKHTRRAGIYIIALNNIKSQNEGQKSFEFWAKKIASDALERAFKI